MARLLAASAVPAVMMAMGTAAPVPKVKPVYYHPTTVGDEWVMLVDGKVETTTRVTAVEDRGGAKVVTTVFVRPDGTADTGDISADGVTVSSACGFPIDPPMTVLKLPAAPGVKWDMEFAERRRDDPPILLCGYSQTVTVAGTEEVVVPAGRYKAVRLDIVWKSDGQSGTKVEWVAVGMVKSEASGVVREMKSFKTGDATSSPANK